MALQWHGVLATPSVGISGLTRYLYSTSGIALELLLEGALLPPTELVRQTRRHARRHACMRRLRLA